LKIKKDFYDYVISVDEEKVKDLYITEEERMLHIPYDSKSDWYDEEIGFNPKNDASFDSRCV